ncbi:MAG: LptF/LptG family permease [candidate division WOR-3 bacterium]
MKNKILDVYIIKKFFLAILFSLIGLSFIYIITNFFENIGYFVDKKTPSLIILEYYLLFYPKVILLIMPLATLMGIYFSLGLITRHNEVLALRALGISPFRIYRAIFLYGFLLSIVIIFFNLSLIPKTKENLKEFKKVKIEKIVQDFDENYARDINYITDTGEMVSIKRLIGNEIHAIHILTYRDGKMISRIDAGRGIWKDSLWILLGAYKRTFEEDSISFNFSDTMKVECFRVSPQEIAKSKKDPLNFSFFQLFKYIKKLERTGQRSGAERVELYERISYPLVNFIILFLGCPLALEVKRRGLIFGFGLGILLSFIFWGIIQLFKELGINGNLPPSLSILIPNMVFLFIGLYLMFRKDAL